MTNTANVIVANSGPTMVSDVTSIDIGMYVSQLEKRVSEQEQLISLLNEKIALLETKISQDNNKRSYKTAVSTSVFPNAVQSSEGVLEKKAPFRGHRLPDLE